MRFFPRTNVLSVQRKVLQPKDAQTFVAQAVTRLLAAPGTVPWGHAQRMGLGPPSALPEASQGSPCERRIVRPCAVLLMLPSVLRAWVWSPEKVTGARMVALSSSVPVARTASASAPSHRIGGSLAISPHRSNNVKS